MNNFDTLREALQNLTTAENSDAIINVSQQIKILEDEHNHLKEENTKLKDKIVSFVNDTHFKTEPKEEIHEEEKSLEEVMQEELNKIIKERK